MAPVHISGDLRVFFFLLQTTKLKADTAEATTSADFLQMEFGAAGTVGLRRHILTPQIIHAQFKYINGSG